MPRVPGFVFRGHFERDEKYVYAVCPELGVVAHGADETEALARLDDALQLYLRTLTERKELEAAVGAGKVHLDLVPSAVKGEIRATVTRTDNDFQATLAAVR